MGLNIYRWRVVCYWPSGTVAASAGRHLDKAVAEREAVELARTFTRWRVVVERVVYL